jgi:hypothetical protein
MEVLGPSPSPPLASPCPSLRCGGRREQCHGEPWVYVAVGRSPEKTLGLLRWALRRFGNPRIVLLHVHQPSPLIPTLCEYCDSSVTHPSIRLLNTQIERKMQWLHINELGNFQ